MTSRSLPEAAQIRAAWRDRTRPRPARSVSDFVRADLGSLRAPVRNGNVEA